MPLNNDSIARFSQILGSPSNGWLATFNGSARFVEMANTYFSNGNNTIVKNINGGAYYRFDEGGQVGEIGVSVGDLDGRNYIQIMAILSHELGHATNINGYVINSNNPSLQSALNAAYIAEALALGEEWRVRQDLGGSDRFMVDEVLEARAIYHFSNIPPNSPNYYNTVRDFFAQLIPSRTISLSQEAVNYREYNTLVHASQAGGAIIDLVSAFQTGRAAITRQGLPEGSFSFSFTDDTGMIVSGRVEAPDSSGSFASETVYTVGNKITVYRESAASSARGTIIERETYLDGLEGKILQSREVFDSSGTLIRNGVEPHCFLAGTPVLMANKSFKAIQLCRTGDEVLSFQNGKDKKSLRPAKVKTIFQNLSTTIMNIRGIHVTPGHFFLSEDNFYPILEIIRKDGTLVDEYGHLIRARTGAEVGDINDMGVRLSYRCAISKTLKAVVVRAGIPWATDKSGRYVTLASIIRASGFSILQDGRLADAEGARYEAFEWHSDSFTPFDSPELQMWVVSDEDGKPYVPSWIEEFKSSSYGLLT